MCDVEPRLPSEVWRLVEYHLRHYADYGHLVAGYESEREAIAEPNMTSHVGAAVQHGIGNPTMALAARMEQLATSAANAGFLVRAIDDVMAGLGPIERRVIEDLYWRGQTAVQVAEEIGMSEASLRRTRKPVMTRFAVRMGLWS